MVGLYVCQHIEKEARMSERNFWKMVRERWAEDKFVCVGLDSPDVDRMKTVVDVTRDLVCCYKPNTEFYLSEGSWGLEKLRALVAHINHVAPDVGVILDRKAGDIGHTNVGTTQMAFEYLKVDAVTVSPYVGAEALKPFLDYPEKGILVLCKTSNPGAGEFQDIDVIASAEEERRWGLGEGGNEAASLKLYEYVAYRVSHEWNRNGNCALVVGATYPEELRQVRYIVWDTPILLPGVGFQQQGVPLEAQVEQIVTVGKDSHGQGFIVNSARGIINADDPRAETQKLHNLINQYR